MSEGLPEEVTRLEWALADAEEAAENWRKLWRDNLTVAQEALMERDMLKVENERLRAQLRGMNK